MDENGNFLNQEQISKKFNIKCNFLEVLQLRQSIPSEWRQLLYNNYNHKKGKYDNDIFIDNCMHKQSLVTTKVLYASFIKQKEKQPACVAKWETKYPGFKNAHEDIWSNIFTLAFDISRETYLQTFQYKIIHRLITCQKKLFDMNLATSPTCLYCNDVDSIEHFFISCPKVSIFWNSFFIWWNNLADIIIPAHYEDLEESIIFGFQIQGGTFSVLNYCVLVAKHYIYCNRIHNDNNINFLQYLVVLKSKLNLEKQICKSTHDNNFEEYEFVYDNL